MSSAMGGRVRVLRALVGVAVAGTLVVGCGGSDGSDGAGGSGASTTSAAASSTEFVPFTATHVFGETEIDARPERIVSLDPQWTDVLLAMGVTPVGYLTSAQLIGSETFPWQEDMLADSTAIEYTDSVPLETVAALQPDLVLGTYVFTDQ